MSTNNNNNEDDSNKNTDNNNNNVVGTTDDNNSNIEPNEILNINVGVLGHVDSGKTSLVKALSTLLSTAALDKSKQSRQRGMTLDLGFSCFFLNTIPKHIQKVYPNIRKIQITLVDCPGHASLIKTIIGGAQIIDIVLLVIDSVKGWQAQTTECLVLAELCTPNIMIALNKIDQFPIEQRSNMINITKRKVLQRLQNTKFANYTNIPIVGVAACIGGEKVAAVTNTDDNNTTNTTTIANETSNINVLIETLQNNLPIPNRQAGSNNNFYFSIDHCFPIRGRGTVLTGTCLSGTISVNDIIEFPTLQEKRKIKSIQMFKRSVQTINQGDRAGICISNFDSTLIERNIASTPNTIHVWKSAIAIVKKVQYYNGTLHCNSKFHISVGHTTIMANVTFFGAHELASSMSNNNDSSNNENNQKKETTKSLLGETSDIDGLPQYKFDFNQDFLQQDRLLESLNDNGQNNGVNNSNENSNTNKQSLLHWALLEFQTPVYCPIHSLIIGSRLDTVENSNNSNNINTTTTGSGSSCRLAFSGRLIERIIDPDKDIQRIRLYTPKERRGIISRLGEPYTRTDDKQIVRYEVFGSDLFKKETNMKIFIGMKLMTEYGDIGEIKSSFGTAGKFRVYFPAGITNAKEGDALILKFKRFIHDPNKSMHQDDIQLPKERTGNRIEIIEKKKNKPKKLEPGVHRFGEVSSIKGDKLENGKLNMAIISGLFDPEINIKEKAGTKVRIPSTNEEGTILGPFGKAGKCKVSFEQGISANVGDKAELRV